MANPQGTTSAYAENTFGGLVLSPPNGNYLRVRGEYLSAASLALPLAELPPRTRRIPRINQLLGELIGTTSAYAENTALKPPKRLLPRNYLRVRGEYASPHCRSHPPKELPPRTRRIQFLYPRHDRRRGTTSAYAENTPSANRHLRQQRNYLRVRGEYRFPRSNPAASPELPPRTRRIHGALLILRMSGGTTSAYAENTRGGKLLR